MKLIKTRDYDELSLKTANIIAAQITLKSDSVLGLATGSSPVGTYKKLVEMNKSNIIDFKEIRTVNLDEYCGLSPENPQSYRYFMNDNLFNHINIDINNTHIPNGIADNLENECERYDNLINTLGGIDIQLLGIGANGHIGFNEPNSCFDKLTHIVTLGESTIKANSRFFKSEEEVPKHAITMGIKSIMQAKKIVIIGDDKKYDILQKSMFGPVTPEVPASILQLHDDITVIYISEKDL